MMEWQKQLALYRWFALLMEDSNIQWKTRRVYHQSGPGALELSLLLLETWIHPPKNSSQRYAIVRPYKINDDKYTWPNSVQVY